MLIPAVERWLDRSRRRKIVPTGSYVFRHCPLYPGPHPRWWYDRVGSLEWIHAVYDYLRSLPIGGIEPRQEVTIPGEGRITLSSSAVPGIVGGGRQRTSPPTRKGVRKPGRLPVVSSEEVWDMATIRQKEAARRNLEKARQAKSARAHGAKIPRSPGLSTAHENQLSDKDFAFPEERKEPLTDARHVRNAVARFDQVEGVTDRQRDRAWSRIGRAAKRFGVEIKADDWRELFAGGKAEKQ